MTKENSLSPEKDPQKINQFIKKHRLAILSASTIAGAAVYLTAKYLIEKHKSKQEINPSNLEPILEEAITQESDPHALLETGVALANNAGRQKTSQAAQELAQNTDDPDLTEALITLSQISKI